MGKTERRNVSQKKKSPVRTTLKLRKEKKMKGGELSEGDIDMIKNRNPQFQITILNLVNKYEAKMNEYGYIIEENGYIIEENDLSKPMFKLNTMIKAYFDKKFKKEDFSKNYETYIINVITTLKTSLIDLNNKIKKIPPGYVSTQEEYNKLTILIQSVNDFITIMEAIAEGAEIKIPTEDESAAGATTTYKAAAGDGTTYKAAGADDKSAESDKSDTNITVAATTGLAAADASTGNSDTAVTIPTIIATGDGTNITATDTDEMIKKLNDGLVIIHKIDIISKGMDKEDQERLSKKLNPIKRVINVFLIYKNSEIKKKFKEFVKKYNAPPRISFFNERLLKGELIITVDNISTARDSLSKLKSNLDKPQSLGYKVIENSKNELTKETFEKNINFLIELLDEIEKEVEKESQDTTSETKDKSNTNTNEIKETNNITIDSDEELVKLNITDQEGHIICSYILKFTRKGQGESLTIASASEFKRDPINDQFDTPTIVLTVKMNEPFTINGNSFIISN
jgi:hypothetical protein